MKSNWQTKQFIDCIDNVIYTSKIQRKNFLYEGNYPIVSQEYNLINGYWDNASDLFRINRPVIIFGDHTKALKYIDFDFVLGADGVKILQPKEFLVPRFFYYQLQSVHLDSLGYARHYKLLKELEIGYPEISEQQQIVKVLDRILEKMVKAKENAEKNLQNARDLFESYLQSIFNNPGDGWEIKKLGEVYDVRDGTHDSPKYHNEGFPLITSKNLKNDLLTFKNVQYISDEDYIKINERSKVDRGDVLFAMIGTIGNPVVVEVDPIFAIKNVALFKIPKNQSNYFLKYYLDSKLVIEKMSDESKGATQKFVGLGYLRNFIISIPSFPEQQNIVAKLDALSAETKKLETIYQQKLNDLEELKKSILQKAFKGELTGGCS